MAGNKVTAATKATAIPIAETTPTVLNTPIWAKLIRMKVMPTMLAEAMITLPMAGMAVLTASV